MIFVKQYVLIYYTKYLQYINKSTLKSYLQFYNFLTKKYYNLSAVYFIVHIILFRKRRLYRVTFLTFGS